MAFQFGEVIERIGVANFAGVYEAHKDVADVSAVAGLVEQRIPPVANSLF